MERISDIINETELKKNFLRKSILTLLVEWKDFDNHLDLTQQCFQETYTEQNSRENHLLAIHESIKQSSNELETIRKSIESRFQKVEQKENEFHLFHKKWITELELKEKKLGLIQKEAKLREERLHKQEKSIEMEIKRFENLRKLVDQSVNEMNLKQKKLKAREQELQLREKHLHSIHKLKPTGSRVTNARDENVKHIRKVSEASASMAMVDAAMPRESGEQKNKGKKRNRTQVEEESPESCDPCIRKNEQLEGIHQTGTKFYDFGKDIGDNCFAVDQIWALYDTIDGMPRFYAQIKKVFKPGFKVRITWLEADVEDQTEVDWVKKELPYGCGRFGCGDSDVVLDRFTFSHQVKCRDSFVIYPGKGEVWAVFKDWDIKWSSDSKEDTNFKYEIVEIVKDFVEDVGIRVTYLDKVEGFRCLFQRSNESEMETLVIPSNELLRFSHRIPSFKMSGNEKNGVPGGSFELDSASLPTNPNKICYPGKVREESRSVNAGIGGSSRNVDVSSGGLARNDYC